VLRQDPDVILLGEIPDTRILDAALKAAETGHLVITTLHTPDVMATISRIVAMFPPEDQEVARVRLAESLHAIVSQRLLPRADGNGRCVAVEIMICTPEIREHIRDRTRVAEIGDAIEAGSDAHGMQSLDQHLLELVSAGIITPDTAGAASNDSSEFQRKLKALK
jgi:twitching motility protein PilT